MHPIDFHSRRQLGFGEGTRPDGRPCCHILMERELIPVRPTPRRAFQGWRYLSADDAPADITAGKGDQIGEMPPKLRKQLAELGLL